MKFPERLDLSRLPWQAAARVGPVLVWGGALAVTAWVAADLFWRFNAPLPPALPVANLADPQLAAQAISSRHLLGQAATGGPVAAPAAPGRYTLQAVVTGAGGRPGWAIIAIDGGPQQGFVEGQEIRPGVSLATVAADAVELSTGGARQTVRLTERAGMTTAGQAGYVPSPSPHPGGDADPQPTGFPTIQPPPQTPAQPQFQPQFQPFPNPSNQ